MGMKTAMIHHLMKVEFNIADDAAHGKAFVELLFNDNTQ